MKTLARCALFSVSACCALLPLSAHAGALNRPAGIGTQDVGIGTDPDGLYIPHNLASRTQFKDDEWHVEVGAELIVPKFSYRDPFGRRQTSKNIVHPTPLVMLNKRVNPRLVLNLDINTPYGQGTSVEKNREQYGMDTSSLITLTKMTASAAYQLTDRLSVGAGAGLGYCQLKWVAPFDINRHPLPFATESSAYGIGAGLSVSLYYEFNDFVSMGINYDGQLRADASGATDFFRGPLEIHDNRFDTVFIFPDMLNIALAIKPNPRCIFTVDWTQSDYSRAQSEIIIDFRNLPIKKPLVLNWNKVQSVHAGVAYKINDHWTVRGGTGWMSCGINNIDTLTVDVPGYHLAAGFSWRRNDFELSASYTFGTGDTTVHREIFRFLSDKYTADVSTFALSGTWKL